MVDVKLKEIKFIPLFVLLFEIIIIVGFSFAVFMTYGYSWEYSIIVIPSLFTIMYRLAEYKLK